MSTLPGTSEHVRTYVHNQSISLAAFLVSRLFRICYSVKKLFLLLEATRHLSNWLAMDFGMSSQRNHFLGDRPSTTCSG